MTAVNPPLFPNIPLSEGERLWLSAVYSKMLRCQKIDTTTLSVELDEKLPEDFKWFAIDRRLLNADSTLTLLGVLHINPNTDLVEKTDQVIRYIRGSIKREPNIRSLTAEAISEDLGLASSEVEIVLGFLTDFNNHFFQGSTQSPSLGCTSLTIDSEYVKKNYLRYKGIYAAIQQYFESNEPARVEGHQILPLRYPLRYLYDSPVTSLPVETLDFSFVVNPELLRIIERDYAELVALNPSEHTKSCLILAGGIIEALLLDALVTSEYWTQEDASTRYLKEMIHPAIKIGIIRHDKLTNVLRIFRNLVHPAREIRDKLSFDESDAKHAVTSVGVIVRDIREWWSKRDAS
ncbi:MAG: hypothetical protein QOE77_2492 [Blastocatellia bacterium]|jgi:hypothetical protein|nr:hypothetical protein [Blastocatellia bacterium]